jgi:hypothetical protein
LKGGLKVHVKAADFGKAKELLYQFKGTLPPSASMAHINIKTQKNDDWFDQHDASKLGQSLRIYQDYNASFIQSVSFFEYARAIFLSGASC